MQFRYLCSAGKTLSIFNKYWVFFIDVKFFMGGPNTIKHFRIERCTMHNALFDRIFLNFNDLVNIPQYPGYPGPISLRFCQIVCLTFYHAFTVHAVLFMRVLTKVYRIYKQPHSIKTKSKSRLQETAAISAWYTEPSILNNSFQMII